MLQNWNNTLRQNRKIIAFLAGQAVSLFGSSLVQYAIMWYITLSTKSGIVLAIYSVCSFLPQILISLFAGVWADRYNRKALIIIADATIAVSTLILMVILLAGYEGLALIYAIAAIRALGSGIQTPAVSAVLPQIVPEEQLMRVNSVNGTIQSAVMLVAPAVSGAVLAFGSLPNILMIDVVTAAIGISILAFLHIPLHKNATQKHTDDVWADLKAGVRYARGSFFVRRLTLYFLLVSILLVPTAMFNVLFVTRTYGDSYFYLTWNEVIFFVGSIAGGIALASWGGFKNRLYTLGAGCILFGLASTLMGFAPAFVVYLVFMFFAGLSMPTFQTPVMVLLQEKVPADMLGRIFSLMQIVNITVLMLSSMVFGPLADVFPLGWMMIICGLLTALIGVAAFWDKRFLQEGLPKKDPAETGEASL